MVRVRVLAGLPTMKCRKCGHELEVGEYGDVQLTNGLYGCDTGCEYVRFEVDCPNCGDHFEKGEFGWFDDVDEKAEYLADFTEEYQNAG